MRPVLLTAIYICMLLKDKVQEVFLTGCKEARSPSIHCMNYETCYSIYYVLVIFYYTAIITHGSTIALQPLYDKRNWLGCSGTACGKEACPNLYMEGDDWNKCMGQVFEIYHMCGPGEIKVGEAVGIYYPKEKNWFGCAGANCGKAGCPGKQSAQYGFENLGKWLGCWGEVFEIYARGKNPGEPITAHDDVILYYPRAADYVGLGNQAGHAGCPGKVQPPPKERYDVCWGEIFEIYLKADDSVFVQTEY